jgi:hypothetical protein
MKKRILPLALAILMLATLVSLTGCSEDIPAPKPNGGGNDLFQLAQGVKPKTEDGYESTYGDVFSWLMTDRTTKLDQQGDVAYLTFSGKVTGGDYPVSIVLRMTGLSADAAGQRLYPHTMTLNGIDVQNFEDPAEALGDLFWAHHNRDDYKTFMDYVEWDNENAFGRFKRNIAGFDGLTGSDQQDSELVGYWEPVTENFIDFFYPLDVEFFPDGIVIVHGNLFPIPGEWVDSGNGNLSVTGEDGDTYMFTYEISEGLLTITDSDGDSNVFSKVSDS